MPKYELKVIDARQETPDVKSIILEKPDKFDFKPGQFVTMKLDAPGDQRGGIRTLSIAASPTENFLMFTTRISASGFKQKFNSLKAGDKVNVIGPFGNFILHDDFSHKAVLIAGGIGITPFRSMIQNAADEKLALEIDLLYSNRSFEQIAYYKEFEKLQKQNSKFVVYHTLTDETPEHWSGGIGRITEDTIMEITDADNSTFYVCGPPGMVNAMEALLKGMNISPERIKAERFEGY